MKQSQNKKIKGSYKIRVMNKVEVADIAVKWAEKEGWNPGLYDAECFYATDPNGFFVGELDGKIVSCISAVRYDEKFGFLGCFLGFYIVAPEYRGKGLGVEIFAKGLQYLGKRNVGADGVLARVEDYKKFGFQPAYKNRRYQGFGAKRQNDLKELIDIKEVDFNALAAYDDSIFPAKRHTFLKCWIAQPGTQGYAYIAENKILGYGVIRKCFKGHKIGPLFSDNSEIAETIFNALIGSVGAGEEVFFDTPETNPQAVALAEKNAMRIVFETARIYLLEKPCVPLEKVFGVTSFELG
ncbi:MAG: GNAT family N-acetyltransferase [Candidatus Omnitrophica bacterium]|nr:GNAT family N-acetyltransferase [Candidatus Omnitrophota bacterium]